MADKNMPKPDPKSKARPLAVSLIPALLNDRLSYYRKIDYDDSTDDYTIGEFLGKKAVGIALGVEDSITAYLDEFDT